MSCTIDPQRIQETIAFHGHECPGLTIGIRAAELALRELGSEAELVCVTETDMCAVDAIQALTGCTFGKGNLIHRDYGKAAFGFYDRTTGRGVRAVLRPESRGTMDDRMAPLNAKLADGSATDEDRQRLDELRAELRQRFLDLDLEELFEIGAPREPLPRPAQILDSLVCATCGERTMESRTRRFAGKTLCIPCFEQVEQKR